MHAYGGAHGALGAADADVRELAHRKVRAWDGRGDVHEGIELAVVVAALRAVARRLELPLEVVHDRAVIARPARASLLLLAGRAALTRSANSGARRAQVVAPRALCHRRVRLPRVVLLLHVPLLLHAVDVLVQHVEQLCHKLLAVVLLVALAELGVAAKDGAKGARRHARHAAAPQLRLHGAPHHP